MLFNLDICKEIMESEQLLYGVDLFLCKYVHGARKNLEKTGPIK